MTFKKVRLAIIVAAAIAVFAGCGSSNRSSNELVGPADTIALYNSKCISCHAADLSGRVGPDSDLRTVGARMTKEEIVHQITNGGDVMPPFQDKLSTAEIESLSEWLAAHQ
ncbi:c-type cytochrome [Paenibacillus xylaniclasticus]|uniref:c-type cytochrome n=1 Tax=Paenibacillus xylaniclasticus TaxID=588083 RepID=UPI000FDB4F7F|nr:MULTISPECIES: cytochrome c [Paenibacillus]GFN29903.1 hypothetical protein PCURB6_01630 [Paenibacillus curdlanolyticus]